VVSDILLVLVMGERYRLVLENPSLGLQIGGDVTMLVLDPTR
jgi:hypothetical protein